MFCENCGKELKEDDLFCENCGTKVPGRPTAADAGNEDSVQKAAEAFLGGNQDAFQDIYHGTYREVYKIARAFFPDSIQDCEDCIQMVYMRVYEKISRYDPAKGRFLPWLKTVAGNVCKDEYKRVKSKKGTERSIEDMTWDDEPDRQEKFADENMTFNPEAHADREETIRLIREILGSLPEKISQTVMLYYGGGYKQEELAGILGISLPAVKKRLKNGKKMVEEKVLALEKRGTKLYSMAPIAFFAWLLANDTAQVEAAGAFVYHTGHGSSLEAQQEQSSKSTPEDVVSQAAGSTGQSAASGTASAGVAGAGKAAAIKAIAGITAAAVIGGGAYAGVKVYQDSRGGQQESTSGQEKVESPDPEAEALMQEIDTEELAVQLVAGCPLDFDPEEVTNTFNPDEPIDSQQLYNIYERNILASLTGVDGASYLDDTVTISELADDRASADLAIFDKINQLYGISDELISEMVQNAPKDADISYTEDTVTWIQYAPDIINTARVDSLELMGRTIEVRFTVDRYPVGGSGSGEGNYTSTLVPADNEFGYQITSIQYPGDGGDTSTEDRGASQSEPFLSMEEIDSYETLAKEYGKFFYGTDTGESIFSGDRGMMDPYHGMGPGASEDYSAIYYTLYDMNSDGVDECFFTSDPGTEQTDSQGYYGIWTMVDGKPIRFADCGYRTHQYICDDGVLRSEYSGGAEVSDIYYYAIGEDGTAEEVDFVGYDWDDYEEKRPEVAALEEKHPRREGLEFDWIKIEK